MEPIIPTTTRDRNAEAEAQAAATAVNVSGRRSSIPSFMFMMFMFYMFSSHDGEEFLARHQYQNALESLVEQHSNFTAWMNGTQSNFTLPPEDKAFQPLVAVFQPPPPSIDPLIESFYPNITGFLHGDLKFNNVSAQATASNETVQWKDQAADFMAGVNTTTMIEKLGTWNWAGSTKVSFNTIEKLPSHLSSSPLENEAMLLRGRIELEEEVESDTLRFDFEGVHFISEGAVYGFAEPNGQQIDIRLLPSLVPEVKRNLTAKLVAPELQTRIDKLKDLIDAGLVEPKSNTNEEEPATTCPFIFHAQLEKTGLPRSIMQEIDSEVQTPTGIRTPPIPNLALNGVLVSKECGVLYEVVNTEGMRSPLFFRKVTLYAGITGFCYLLIMFLHARQAEISRTASNISRVSRWTFFTQATMDSVSFASHLTFAIMAEGRSSMSLMVPAFLVCVLFVHEAQFAVLVQNIQGPESFTPPTPPQLPPQPQPTPATPAPESPSATNPEDEAREPLLASYPPAPNPPPATPQATVLPAPTAINTNTNPNQRMSFGAFLIHHIQTDPQARSLVLMVIFFVFIVRVILSPLLTVIFIAITYSLVWLPQISRSVMRGRSSGFTTEYVLGTTLCRLYLILYFFACPKNVLEVTPRSWVWPLAVFILFQAFVVVLQDSLGPTFFMPQTYSAPKAYDYHPPMALPDTESPEKSLGDCAICMDAIIIEAPSPSSSPFSYRRSKSLDGRDGWGAEKEKGRLNAGSASGSGSGSGSSSAMMSTTQRATSRISRVLNAFHLGSRAAEARQIYSLAPCSHLFHTGCLEKWLAIKNICPQCRRPLPPL